MPDRERKWFSDQGSNVLKGSLPKGPSAHPRNTENLRLSDESEKESTDEATQERYGGAVPETMWKQMRAILY